MDKPTSTQFPERRLQEPDFHVVGAFSLERPSEWKDAAAPSADRPIVYATASSTANDLDSDRMDTAALEIMTERFVGLTVFLNHRYNWPEDVFGMILRTKLVEREGVLDLDMEIAVEDQNPRAFQSYKMIKNGTRAGVSVGVLVLDYETIDEKHLGRKVIVIKDVLPLEASIVGIPANPRSWVHEAIKAMVLRGILKLSCDELGCRPWLDTAALQDDLTQKLWEETENEIRYRLRDPDDFDSDSFRRITLKKDKPRIFAIIGKLDGEDTTTLQSLRFPKGDGWTLSEAKAWVKEHKDELKGVDEENDMARKNDLVVIATMSEEDRAALINLATLMALDEAERADLTDLATLMALSEDDRTALRSLYQTLTEMDEAAQEALGRLEGLDDATLAALASAACLCGQHTPGYRFALRMLASLADELAEMEFSQKFWRLTYAFCDAVWDVIEHETGDARVSGVDGVITEYRNLVLGLVSSLPAEAEKPEMFGSRTSFGLQAVRDLMWATGVDKLKQVSETDISETIADLTSRADLVMYAYQVKKAEAERLQSEFDEARQFVEEILDLPLALKTADGKTIQDAARDIQRKRYPDLSPAVSSLLTEDE